MDRRSFCKTVASAVVGVSAAGVTGSATADEQAHDGYVSTRDHFGAGFWGPYLTDGVSPTEYETTTVPGFDDEASPETLVVFIHGWANDTDAATTNFSDFTEALDTHGTAPPVVGFTWDSYVWWHHAVQIARQNAVKLATFLSDYRERNPETKINLVTHSLGAQVALSTLVTLDSMDFSGRINCLSMLGPAVPRYEASMGGTYGPLIEEETQRTDVFYKTDDTILNWAFSGGEIRLALGSHGIIGELPSTYAEHDVTDDVESHTSYQRIDGCVDQVLDTW